MFFLNLDPTDVSLVVRRGKKILKAEPAKEKTILDKIEN